MHFLLCLETASETGTGERFLLGGERHVLHGVRSSLATVSTRPVTRGAIKLPVIIHRVLRVLLSTFRSDACPFPLTVAVANSQAN